MKLSEIKKMKNLMILMKGESGTGKTIAAASFPEPIKMLSCDGRIEPLLHFPKVRERDIDVDIYNKYSDIIQALESLTRGNSFCTIVVDGLMAYSRLVISHIIEQRGGQTEVKIKGEKEPLTVGGIPIMAINEYKGESSALFNLVMALRVLKEHGANIILTAHVVVSEQQVLGGSTRVTRQLLTGGVKIGAEIPTYFDEVYHFYGNSPGLNETPRYYAITQGTGDDYARTSFYGLQKEIDFTDGLFYDELLKAIDSIGEFQK